MGSPGERPRWAGEPSTISQQPAMGRGGPKGSSGGSALKQKKKEREKSSSIARQARRPPAAQTTQRKAAALIGAAAGDGATSAAPGDGGGVGPPVAAAHAERILGRDEQSVAAQQVRLSVFNKSQLNHGWWFAARVG